MAAEVSAQQEAKSPPSLADLHPSRLSNRSYESVLEMILSGDLSGGSIIPERRLAVLLGVSRTPLREALGRLEGEGYVARQGRNMVVTSVTVQEVMEILEMRRLLECEAVRLATERLPPAALAELRRALEEMSDPSATSDAHHRAVDDRLHLGIAEASGNRLLKRTIEDLRNKTRMFGLRRIPSRFEPGRAEHLEILEAMEARDAQRAHGLMHRHLENVKQGILTAIMAGQGS